jgi:hypothetical protein
VKPDAVGAEDMVDLILRGSIATIASDWKASLGDEGRYYFAHRDAYYRRLRERHDAEGNPDALAFNRVEVDAAEKGTSREH